MLRISYMSCVRLQTHSNGEPKLPVCLCLSPSLSITIRFPRFSSPTFSPIPILYFFFSQAKNLFPFQRFSAFSYNLPFSNDAILLLSVPLHYHSLSLSLYAQFVPTILPCLLQVSISFLSLAYMVMFHKFQDLIPPPPPNLFAI